MVSEEGRRKFMEITPMMTPLMETRSGWWRPKIILWFEENPGYYGLMDSMRLGLERKPWFYGNNMRYRN